MCLLIASPKGNPLSDRAVIEAWSNNPDGFGIVYADQGKLHIRKTRRLKAVFALIEEAGGKPFVAHFRWATHGIKNIDNCHPFSVDRDLAMAHNGIINIKRHDPLKSDSWHYTERLKTFPDVLGDSSQEMIAAEIGMGNKLAFLHSSGLVKIVNEKQGTWDDAIWYSNTYKPGRQAGARLYRQRPDLSGGLFTMKKSLETLETHIKDAQYFLHEARLAVDLEPDEITQAELTDARNELANASNAIDDAMGEIDTLLAPERTREESYDS